MTRLTAFVLSLSIHAVAALAVSPSGPDRANVAASQSRAASSSDTAQVGRANTTAVSASSRSFAAAPVAGFRALQQTAAQQLDSRSTTELAKWLNHLWQSTWFVLAVALLTRAFQRNHARVRYWLWFSASMKFLIPLSLLIALGSRFPSAANASSPAAAMSSTLAQFSQPFDEPPAAAIPYAPALEASHWTGIVILAIWTVGFLMIVQRRWRMWQTVRRALKSSTPVRIPRLTLPRNVLIRSADSLLEPGVVGFWRPVVLLPSGIEQHLTPAQLEAVATHELCHVKYGDNLTAALHMLVEVIFWFHPFVWWIGAQLVRERERACDEEVLRVCGEPDTYANGIVNVCKRYVEQHVACVAGVSGSDLRKRIETIMTNQQTEFLRWWKKALLVTSAIAVLLAPITIGSLTTLEVSAQAPAAQGPDAAASALAFETASIKPNKSGQPFWQLEPQPGRITAVNATAKRLIRFAYDLSDFQLAGGPSWLDSERFDLSAKAQGEPTLAQERAMLRRLLAERFGFVAHTESRSLPIYALVMARSDARMGPRLRRAQADCSAQSIDWSQAGPTGIGFPLTSTIPGCGYFGFAPGTDLPNARGGLAFRGLTMAGVAKLLIPMVARNVTDQTGLGGYFDGDFDFALEIPPPPPPPGQPNPFVREQQFLSVFTVFPEQLGLKLDPRRGPVEVLVIDNAEHPSDN